MAFVSLLDFWATPACGTDRRNPSPHPRSGPQRCEDEGLINKRLISIAKLFSVSRAPLLSLAPPDTPRFPACSARAAGWLRC